MLGDARMRNESRQAPEPLQIVGSEQRAQIVEPFARRQRQRMRAPFAQHFAQSRSAGGGCRAAIAFGVGHRGTAFAQRIAEIAAPAFAAEDHDALAGDVAQFGQRQQSCAVERRRRNPCFGNAGRGQRRRRARPGRQREQLRRPRLRGGHAVFDGIGGDEDRDVVLVERRVHGVERRAVRRRQDHDRGKDDRRGAKRRQLPREPGRLACRPRDDHADAGQRAAAAPAALAANVRSRRRLAGSGRDEARRTAREEIVGQILSQLRRGLAVCNVGLDFTAQDVPSIAARQQAA